MFLKRSGRFRIEGMNVCVFNRFRFYVLFVGFLKEW